MPLDAVLKWLHKVGIDTALRALVERDHCSGQA